MAVAATSCSFSSLAAAHTSRYSPISFHRRHLSTFFCRSAPRAIAQSNKGASSSPGKPWKQFGGGSEDDEKRRTQSSPFKSFGAQSQRREYRGLSLDLKEQQKNESGSLEDAAFLNAVVKVYCTHTEPDYSLPWQKQRQYTSTGSAFIIEDGKLLTNAHCIEHATQVEIMERPDFSSERRALMLEEV